MAPHLRVLPGGADTGDDLVDTLIDVVAEAVALMDPRFFLSRVDEVAQTPGRYFEVSLDEASEMTGGELRTSPTMSKLGCFERYGWALYLRVPGAVVRITSDSPCRRTPAD